MILIQSLQKMVIEYLSQPQKSMELTVSLTELISFSLIIFEIGYYLGRTYKDIQQKNNQRQDIVEASFEEQTLIKKKNDPVPQNESFESSSVINQSTARMIVVDAAQNKNVKANVVQNILFKEHIPLVSGKKTSFDGTFEIKFQNIGKQYLKIQRREIVTKFDNSPELELQIRNWQRKLKKEADQKNININNMGLKVLIQKNYTNNTTELLFKNINTIQSLEYETKKKGIQVSQSCQNGKFRNMFTEILQIGEGGFGCVYKAVNKIQNQSYAIKIIYLKDLQKNDFLKEVTIISHISHENIVRYYTWWIQQIRKQEIYLIEKEYDFTPSSNIGLKKQISKNFSSNVSNISLTSEESNGIYFEREEQNEKSRKEKNTHKKNMENNKKSTPFENSKNIFSLHIQMELCTGGSLARYLRNDGRTINPSVAFSIFDQILKGISALHSNGIIHRDLKPGNIFLNKNQNLVKIGDFGLSTLVSKEPKNIKEYILNNNLGTPSYMAPELYKKQKILKPELLDIYSLGIIYFELLSKFKTESERITNLEKIKQGVIVLNNFQKQRKLIRLMTRNIKTRYSLTQIRESNIYLELKKQYLIKNWGQLL